MPLEIAVRKEVLDFVLASEALLSPALLGNELTKEERQMIAEYVLTLSRSNQPWAKALPVRYNV